MPRLVRGFLLLEEVQTCGHSKTLQAFPVPAGYSLSRLRERAGVRAGAPTKCKRLMLAARRPSPPPLSRKRERGETTRYL
ncbi:hypothetical protein CBM2586_B10712 [Cupriavidus phytorum]|uniref:Uncharacterized protein n=1 Tax=Cupriavidus taiwanensis TaxID=164546 RepID=A0A975XCU4_9BURK|nr:hypothetical protein CBM2586_B10712 [Cupriavidus taiwanensis]